VSRAVHLHTGGCRTGKHQFATEGEAEQAAANLTAKNLRRPRQEGRTACRAYACADCGQWHVTSTPPRLTTSKGPQ